jgi:hypothetical protein
MGWFKITCRCLVCGYKWSFRTKDPDAEDPPCPRPVGWNSNGNPIAWCGKENHTIGMDLTSNRAPATIGEKLHVKAVDETYNIVSQDYGLTDMRDDVRQGESATPKLPPAQQKMADNYFGGPKQNRMRMPGLNTRAHVAAALSGRLSDPVSTNRSIVQTHEQRIRPPVHIVNRQ